MAKTKTLIVGRGKVADNGVPAPLASLTRVADYMVEFDEVQPPVEPDRERDKRGSSRP